MVFSWFRSNVSDLLKALEHGDASAANQLLPLVYEELRALAAQKLAGESPGQTLQPTALVHEAYLRLTADTGDLSAAGDQHWDGRGHFFAAAAEAMRRILIDRARQKATHKCGGSAQRVDLDKVDIPCAERAADLLALDEALSELERHDAQ